VDLEAVIPGDAEGVDGGDAAGGGREIGRVVEGAAGQVFFQDQGVGEAPRARVHEVGPRGHARGGEELKGVVLVGGLLLQGEAHLGARHEPGHEVRPAPHEVVQAVLAPGEEADAAMREARQALQVPLKVRA